ncbi:uncharacterized protein LOC131921111 isoform X2 [Peromyscus eremicus]|uniref:uncharacterized protein LOC131921111 isoform X2 n=1 Tax=Peromyscus eremicus TaxID=42410 RepID=UPI0027DE34FB|nr:uncharacterized protein LOC131921111 isoform X2 [Peromyscus eremicus]XP_059131771.1 uncharacterized protein LOC131921111 isoform X2 [Peromyscus eremicus]
MQGDTRPHQQEMSHAGSRPIVFLRKVVPAEHSASCLLAVGAQWLYSDIPSSPFSRLMACLEQRFSRSLNTFHNRKETTVPSQKHTITETHLLHSDRRAFPSPITLSSALQVAHTHFSETSVCWSPGRVFHTYRGPPSTSVCPGYVYRPEWESSMYAYLLYSEGQRGNLAPNLILANLKAFLGMRSGGPNSQSPFFQPLWSPAEC